MTLKKILASRSSSSFIFRYIFNTHKELSRSSPIKIPDASMLLLSIRDIFKVQKIIIIISISNKMIKLEIFLEWCKLPLISYITPSLITQKVCKKGTCRNADNCVLGRYIIIILFVQPRNNSARMPADVFPCYDTKSQTVAQGEQFLFKSKLESLNSKAQLSWNASFFLWPCNINHLVKQKIIIYTRSALST